MKRSILLLVSLIILAILGAVLLARMLWSKERQNNKGMKLLNICVLELAVLYLIPRLVIFENGLNSAPGWVVLFEAVYFLVPLCVANIVYFAVRKISRRCS